MSWDAVSSPHACHAHTRTHLPHLHACHAHAHVPAMRMCLPRSHACHAHTPATLTHTPATSHSCACHTHTPATLTHTHLPRSHTHLPHSHACHTHVPVTLTHTRSRRPGAELSTPRTPAPLAGACGCPPFSRRAPGLGAEVRRGCADPIVKLRHGSPGSGPFLPASGYSSAGVC